MKYVVSFTNHDISEAEAKRYLAAYTKWEPPASLRIKEFVLSLNAEGGYLVVETDDPTALLHELAIFAVWASYKVDPVVEISEGVGPFADAIAFRDSVA